MSLVSLIITSTDDEEIAQTLERLKGATSGLGLMHESVNAHDGEVYARREYIHWELDVCVWVRRAGGREREADGYSNDRSLPRFPSLDSQRDALQKAYT